ncbi:MAG: dienelactone hydrolase family protein [Phycisphaeraceae bacterium]
MIQQADEVQVSTHDAGLPGSLVVPPNAAGLVAFAHGSGSSRFSVRNRYVAEVLQQANLATLLFDLLTADEHAVDARTGHLRFDIELLTDRLGGAVAWAGRQRAVASLPLGLFGASTGAAAALRCAAAMRDRVAAVVSRGGRPDLAGDALAQVAAPVLLIVGGADEPVIKLNRRAADRLRGPHELHIVEGATHLFEEPGALEQVAERARDWFLEHLAGQGGSGRQR